MKTILRLLIIAIIITPVFIILLTTDEQKNNKVIASPSIRIIPRDDWWGNLPPGELIPSRPLSYRSNITHVIIHHTGAIQHNNHTSREAVEWVRSIWRHHVINNKWSDIGYNFIIDRFGNIYKGRHNPFLFDKPTREVTGTHARGFNTGTIGIGFLGYFHDKLPSPAALSSAEQLIAWRFNIHNLSPFERDRTIFRIATHRDVNPTGCPGSRLAEYMPTMRQNVAKLLNIDIIVEPPQPDPRPDPYPDDPQLEIEPTPWLWCPLFPTQ